MLLYYTFFFFVALGSKLCLALVMIYLLLPTDRRCNQCDEETLLIRMTGTARLLSRLTGGRLQRRWCPRCGWFGLARPARATGGAGAELSPPARRTPR
jgi:hypothetical protein